MSPARDERRQAVLGLLATHEHLCIPMRSWFRARWICVRCDRTFREDVR